MLVPAKTPIRSLHSARSPQSFLWTQLLLVGVSFSAIMLALLPPVPAQQSSVPLPSTAPLELSLLAPGAVPPNASVVTSSTVSQAQLTIPSLWWAKEQFGDNLLSNWIAYPANGNGASRIDLLVERQNWNSLDYIQRYEFVNEFGTVARDYGYNIRVFNYQEDLLATYTCNYNINPPLCNVQLDATGKSSIRGNPGGLLGG